jgi:hypothetical protein
VRLPSAAASAVVTVGAVLTTAAIFTSFSSLDNYISLSVGLAISVISVNGWHELFEPHSYRCNIDLI